MIETDPHDRTPARTQYDGRAVIHPAAASAADPASVLRVLIQRRQALLHRESAELKSLRPYADLLAHELPPPPALPSGPPAGIEIVTGAEAVGARLDAVLDSAETEVLVLDRGALRASRSPASPASPPSPADAHSAD
ncbi:hypothetical protein, partial [Streptomyces sp. XY413]|uniref:hypothetical protein n=1 Tax=Streptomyces sp. XY413 TaxID=1519479 RepID=UPI003B633293